MVSFILLLTTALATYASAKPILFGFRTVCEAEKKEIKKKGWVFWDERHVSHTWNGQLGIGKAHSNKHGVWQGINAGNIGGDYWCYTTAEESKIREAAKVWINPIENPPPGQFIYPYNEHTIREIVEAAGFEEPKLAIRMGRCMDAEEALIPAALLPGPDDKDGGPLKLRTYCFKKEADMRRHMRRHGITQTEADYDSEPFRPENYMSMSQMKERATTNEGEGEAAAGPARPLRFMPRNSKKTTKGSGKQGTTASGSSFDALELAPGYTITLQRDPKSKKFPNPKVDECPATSGKKPKVSASSGKKPNSDGEKKSNSGGK